MSIFQFALPEDVEPIQVKDLPDTPPTEEAPPVEDGPPSDVSMSFESFGITEEQISSTVAMWGSKSAILNCTGPGNNKQVSPLTIYKGKSGEYTVQFNRPTPERAGMFYTFMMNLTASDTVHLELLDIVPPETILLQSAIKDTKAKVITHIYMVEPNVDDSCKFFVWMLGHKLAPIPYDMISMIEPATMFGFGCSHGTVEARKNALEYDQFIKQNWYDTAMELGLLTTPEVGDLMDGKAITIEGINSRIEAANNKKATT